MLVNEKTIKVNPCFDPFSIKNLASLILSSDGSNFNLESRFVKRRVVLIAK